MTHANPVSGKHQTHNVNPVPWCVANTRFTTCHQRFDSFIKPLETLVAIVHHPAIDYSTSKSFDMFKRPWKEMKGTNQGLKKLVFMYGPLSGEEVRMEGEETCASMVLDMFA
eukprot:364174-Amphidinium_carterae.1